MTNYSEADIQRAREWLDEYRIKPGSTVYTVLHHVSSSGMTRHISVYVMVKGEPRDISWPVSRLLGYPVNTRNHEGLEVGGCGMDMGFHIVYSLSRVLFRGKFRCIIPKKRSVTSRNRDCPSNDHVNARNWNRMPGLHSDAGYALNHKWL